MNLNNWIRIALNLTSRRRLPLYDVRKGRDGVKTISAPGGKMLRTTKPYALATEACECSHLLLSSTPTENETTSPNRDLQDEKIKIYVPQ